MSRPSTVLRSVLHSPALTTNILRILWILFVCWAEAGVYFWSLSICKWPAHETTEDASHVLLISDPQVSVPSRSSILFSLLHTFSTDKFLKKSWYVTRHLDPQAVFFLGDMLSDGKSVKNEAQYSRLVQKFKSLFPSDASTAVYYLPGNNDVGLGRTSALGIRKYYQKHLGLLSTTITLRNHSFFAADAPGLVDEDYLMYTPGVPLDRWKPIPGGAVEAVRDVAAQNHDPLIVLSHIPLYRSEDDCGPLRESGTINKGVGYGYQKTLSKQTTTFLMEALKPSIVFSGNDRDYCEYLHDGTSFNINRSIPEVTVKSFSPTPYIRKPGFQLLSIIAPATDGETTNSLLHHPCFLPDQKFISSGYKNSAFMTFCILVMLNVQRFWRFRHSKPQTPFSLVMPRNQILPMSRSPVASATPSFRTLIAQGLTISSPQLIFSVHDGEDPMFPSRYDVCGDASYFNDQRWRPIDYSMDSDTSIPEMLNEDLLSPSQSIPAPGDVPKHTSAWKSWTFVTGRRQRQLNLFCIPRLSIWWTAFLTMLKILRDGDQKSLSRRKRGIVASTLIGSISIFWPAGVIWLLINCWMF